MDEVSSAVGYNYLIVKNILKHVSWREAEAAEKVCELWKEVVHELKKTQLHVQHFRATHACEEREIIRPASFITSPGCFGTPELLIVFHGKFIKGKRFRGPFSFSPITVDERSRICSYCTKYKLFKHACSFCNTNTKVITILSTEILYLPIQINKNFDHFMSGLVIPKIPGVQVNLLNVTIEDCLDSSKFYLRLNEIMDKNIIKCFLIFISNGSESHTQEKFVIKMIGDTRTIQEITHPTCQFAVCGGIVCDYSEFPIVIGSRENLAKVVVFSVNKSDIDSVEYSAFSSVFSSHSANEVVVENDFMEQLKKISDVIPRRKYGIGIKISSLTRTMELSCENDILAQYFPNIPILLGTSQYQLGVDCFPNLSNEPSYMKKFRHDMYDNCTQLSSSVIVVMTWG